MKMSNRFNGTRCLTDINHIDVVPVLEYKLGSINLLVDTAIFCTLKRERARILKGKTHYLLSRIIRGTD